MIFYSAIHCKPFIELGSSVEVAFCWIVQRQVDETVRANKIRDRSNRSNQETWDPILCGNALWLSTSTSTYMNSNRICSKWTKTRFNKLVTLNKMNSFVLTHRRHTSICKNKTHKSENYCFQFIKFHSIYFPLSFQFAAICVYVMMTLCFWLNDVMIDSVHSLQQSIGFRADISK